MTSTAEFFCPVMNGMGGWEKFGVCSMHIPGMTLGGGSCKELQASQPHDRFAACVDGGCLHWWWT